MKGLLIFLFILAAASTEAQIVFALAPQQKIKDWRLMSVTFGLNKHPNMNMLTNGTGGNNLVIDVNALRHPEKVYNYSELADKIYAPTSTILPTAARVPYFLWMPPPAIRMPEINLNGRRKSGC